MGWVSWSLFIFVFLASFSALWWPNIWPKMGFPELFEKKIYWLHSFHTCHLSLWVILLNPIHFRVPSLIFLKNSHLCSTLLQNRNLYWIFLAEVGSDQSGGILSPFMGPACWYMYLDRRYCFAFPPDFQIIIPNSKRARTFSVGGGWGTCFNSTKSSRTVLST